MLFRKKTKEEILAKEINPLKKYHDENWHTPQGKIIREIVFGINDGLVTTLCFIVAITKSFSQTKILLFAGLAEAIAGAISMFFGAYISTKSEKEFFQKEIERENYEIENMPEQEIAEIYEIYDDLGFEKQEIDIIANRVKKDKKLFLRFMLKEELGISTENLGNPLKAATIMGISFIIGAFAPLLPYLIFADRFRALKFCLLISLISIFIIGGLRTIVTSRGFFRSAVEMTIVATLASTIGYIGGEVANYLLR